MEKVLTKAALKFASHWFLTRDKRLLPCSMSTQVTVEVKRDLAVAMVGPTTLRLLDNLTEIVSCQLQTFQRRLAAITKHLRNSLPRPSRDLPMSKVQSHCTSLFHQRIAALE
jgi:hypothetical protein